MPGLLLGYRCDRRFIRNIQDGTGFETMNIILDKGIAIVTIQADQHLLERNAGVLTFRGNLAQGIAAFNQSGFSNRSRRGLVSLRLS